MAISAPTDLSGLLVWCRAASLSALDHGDPVSVWPDLSGNGNDLTASSGTEPTVQDADGQLGMRSVRFNGTSQFFSLPNVFSGLSAAEVVVVLQLHRDPPTAAARTGLWHFGTATLAAHHPFTDGTIYESFGANSRLTTVNPTPQLDVLGRLRRYGVRIAGGSNNYRTYLDGAQLFQGTATVAFNTTPTLGRNNSSQYLQGRIAAIAIYNRTLSDTERADLDAYFAAEYPATTLASFYAEDFEGFDADDVPSDLTYDAPSQWSVQTISSSKQLRFVVGADVTVTRARLPLAETDKQWIAADLSYPNNYGALIPVAIGICVRSNVVGYWLFHGVDGWEVTRGHPIVSAEERYLLGASSTTRLEAGLPVRAEIRRHPSTGNIQARVYIPGDPRPDWQVDVEDDTYPTGEVAIGCRNFGGAGYHRAIDNIAASTDGMDPLDPEIAPTVAWDVPSVTGDEATTEDVGITVTGEPAPTLTLTSTDDSIATAAEVSPGVVRISFHTAGVATITAEADNGVGDPVTAPLHVIVEEPNPLDPDDWAPLWDVNRGKWTLTPPYPESAAVGFAEPSFRTMDDPPCGALCDCPGCRSQGGFAVHPHTGIMLHGGVHDPALLAYLPAGSAAEWRLSARVSLGALGWWVNRVFDLSHRSVYGGVAIGSGTGVVGQTADWWGFMVTFGNYRPDQALQLQLSSGWGQGDLEIRFISSDDAPFGIPSPTAHAGRQVAVRTMPRVGVYNPAGNAHFGSGAYYTCACGAIDMRWDPASQTISTATPLIFYDVETEITQHDTGIVRIKARVSATGHSSVQLAPLDQGGWHLDVLVGSGHSGVAAPVDLECTWAGIAGRSIFDVAPFQHGYSIMSDFTATPLGGSCMLDPPTTLDPDPPPDPPDPGVVQVDVDCRTLTVDTTDVIAAGAGEITEVEITVRDQQTQTVLQTWNLDPMFPVFIFTGSNHNLPTGVPLEVLVRVFTEYDGWADASDWLPFQLDACLQPCALVLTVFDDDNVTPLWEVSSDPLHPHPFLLDPENYGEQEIDVVNGAATIGQVEVIINDPAQITGDQDSGWMTERLEDLHGRRCRLVRHSHVGEVVIVDGPASTPRMDESYAAHRVGLRDTRETERKHRAFVTTDSFSLFPGGVKAGYGEYAPGQYIVPPAGVAVGKWLESDMPYIRAVENAVTSGSWPDPNETDPDNFPVVDPSIVYRAAMDRFFSGRWRPDINHLASVGMWEFPNLVFYWRPLNDTGPFVEMPGIYAHDQWFQPPFGDLERRGVMAATRPAWPVSHGMPVRGAKTFWMEWIDPAINALRPSHDDDIEYFFDVVGGAPVSAEFPYHVEGITAGQFLKLLYDGHYSPRDADGNVVPTGIRYNQLDLLALTTPVRARITSPVTDVRAWAERHVYTPLGYAPALDRNADISPVTQVPPSDFSGRTLLRPPIVEPSPNWNAGERIINTIDWRGFRDLPDPNSGAIDGVTSLDVRHTFIDPASAAKHGDFELVIEGVLFRAVGIDRFVFGPHLLEAPELQATLAAERGTVILARFAEGAQAVVIRVMRAHTAHLRVGDFVRLDLPWFPDFPTRRRGMLTGGQIVAIKDLDCAWREMLIEEVAAIPAAYS